MIGYVKWGPFTAELLGVDEWRVTAGGREWPALAASLRARYADTYESPSQGYYGQQILRHLAEATGGQDTFILPDTAPDVVY